MTFDQWADSLMLTEEAKLAARRGWDAAISLSDDSKDAARYRYLRSHCRYHYENETLTWYLPRLLAYKGPSPKERLDEQIDKGIDTEIKG